MRAHFRPAAAADLDLLGVFMSSLYAHEAVAFEATRARRGAEWLLANPDCGGIWMIEAEGEPAGYLVLTVCVSLEFHGRFALLDELFIEERRRSRGLGTQAVEFAAEWARARGMDAVRLETAPGNLRAQATYLNAGFFLHDRYLMTRWLSGTQGPGAGDQGS